MVPFVIAVGCVVAAFRPSQVAAGALMTAEFIEGWKNRKKVQAYEDAMRQGHNPFRQRAEADRAAKSWARRGGVGDPPGNPVGTLQVFSFTKEVAEDLRSSMLAEGVREVADVESISFTFREYMLNDEEIFLLFAYVESLLKGVEPSESWWWIAEVSEERLRRHRGEAKKAA